MVKKAKIKLKKKPIKPVRKSVIVTYYIEDGDSLEGLISWATQFCSNDITFMKDDYNSYYGHSYCQTSFIGKRPELDEDYSQRWESYYKSLDKYNKWYAKNETIIKEELKRRKEEAEVKEKKEDIRKEIKIGREKIRLEKELKKIQKKLKNWQ